MAAAIRVTVNLKKEFPESMGDKLVNDLTDFFQLTRGKGRKHSDFLTYNPGRSWAAPRKGDEDGGISLANHLKATYSMKWDTMQSFPTQ